MNNPRRLTIFAAIQAGLSLTVALWLRSFTWIAAHASLWAVSFGIWLITTCVLAAVFVTVKTWPTWYRRLACTIVAWITASQAIPYIAIYFLFRDQVPPNWIVAWLGPPSGIAALGGFTLVAVLAVLDFLSRYSTSGLGWLRTPATEVVHETVSTHLAQPALDSLRRQCLQDVTEDIRNRLNSSLHIAPHIDLGLTDTPAATHLPWIYTDNARSQTFQSYEDAYTTHRGRLLILGHPGSGKTTTLLQLADHLAERAGKEATAPIPFIMALSGLSTWMRRHSKEFVSDGDLDERQATTFESWIVFELTRHPGLTASLARRFLREARVALLLDGIDEIDDSCRWDAIRALNAYIHQCHRDLAIVVTSRVNEYQPFESTHSLRLRLHGAITLEPFSLSQIESYLQNAGAGSLVEPLTKDPALLELAASPFTLTVIALTFKSGLVSELTSGTVPERRYHLLAAFASRMQQRCERRLRGLPYDGRRENDISEREYKYSEKQHVRWLSWLALRMSLRAQSAFECARLYSFVFSKPEKTVRHLSWWAGSVAVAAIVGATMLLVGTSLAIWSSLPIVAVPVIAAIGVLGTLIVQAKDSDEYVFDAEWIEDRLNAILLYVALVLGSCAFSSAYTTVLHLQGDRMLSQVPNRTFSR